jgi:hypothetical protein
MRHIPPGQFGRYLLVGAWKFDVELFVPLIPSIEVPDRLL